MNLIDLMLNNDVDKIERPSKEVEIKRLSEVYGEKFVVLCKALTYDKYNAIQESNMKLDMKTQNVEMDINNMQLEIVLEGVFNAEDKTRFFSNKDVMKHFKVHTHKDLIKKLLLGGEISELSTIITNLSGFGGDTIAEIEGLLLPIATQE